jgi:hypothetical protein
MIPTKFLLIFTTFLQVGILQKIGSKWLQINLSYQTIVIKSNRNVKM